MKKLLLPVTKFDGELAVKIIFNTREARINRAELRLRTFRLGCKAAESLNWPKPTEG